MLIIDELGYLPFEANAAHLFFQLVSRRYEKGSILTTSNRSVGERGSVFGDPVVATAILDRLLHHSTVITIRGDSYRLREKRRSGLLQKLDNSQLALHCFRCSHNSQVSTFNLETCGCAEARTFVCANLETSVSVSEHLAAG